MFGDLQTETIRKCIQLRTVQQYFYIHLFIVNNILVQKLCKFIQSDFLMKTTKFRKKSFILKHFYLTSLIWCLKFVWNVFSKRIIMWMWFSSNFMQTHVIYCQFRHFLNVTLFSVIHYLRPINHWEFNEKKEDFFFNWRSEYSEGAFYTDITL